MAGASLIGRAAAKLERALFVASKRARADRTAPTTTLFVAGVQRSGTNMIMDVLDASRDTRVFHESDPRGYEHFMLRPEPVVRALVAASPARVTVIKALHETERLSGLLERFAPAKLIWIFRAPDAVIASNMKSWPGGRNQIENIVVDPETAAWRGRGMSAATLETLRATFRPDMDDADAQGLFYYQRTELLFDQGLDRDPRTLLIDYDAFTQDIDRSVARLSAFVGLEATARMRSVPRAERARAPLNLHPDVRALVSVTHARLVEAAAR